MIEVCFSTLDPPDKVRLTASNAIVCQDDIITLNCSAHSKPPQLTYRIYENDTLMIGVSSSGIWKRKVTQGGIFVYKCVANNSGGTGNSTSVAVIVNGKKSWNDFSILMLLWQTWCRREHGYANRYLSLINISLLTFYRACRSLIGYATHYLFCHR